MKRILICCLLMCGCIEERKIVHRRPEIVIESANIQEVETPKETEIPKEIEIPKEVETPKETEIPKEIEIPKEVETPKEIKNKDKKSSSAVEKMIFRKYYAPHLDPMYPINRSINPWYDYGY